VDNERAIKAKVIDALRRENRRWRLPVIANEYCVGTTGVRADLALAFSTPQREFVGVEIKSAFDTLRRLPHQLTTYSSVFDRVIVVAATRHQNAVRQYRIPNLEIWELEKSGKLVRVRSAVTRLQRAEFSPFLTQRERNRYKGLIAAGPEGERDAFFAAFEDRYGDVSAEFWSRTQGRRIDKDDVNELSRFLPQRAQEQETANVYAKKLSSWHEMEAA